MYLLFYFPAKSSAGLVSGRWVNDFECHYDVKSKDS